MPKLMKSYCGVIKTQEELRNSFIWMFWRKVLKMRNYSPHKHTINIYKIGGKPYPRSSISFFRVKSNTTFCVYFSKSEAYYFEIFKKEKLILRSKDCANLGEFEDEFKQYFKRKLPILPSGVGMLPDIKI